MMLRSRTVVTCLVAAIPVTALLSYYVERTRTEDMALALDRVVRSQINDQVRERCESDPNWFLTGPLEGRPAKGQFIETTPDALPPRPKVTEQPFELFAYDEQFVPSSSAAARFPPDFRRSLQTSPEAATDSYVTAQGTGRQVAMPTGWIGSRCMYFLGRMAPPPHQLRQRVLTASGFYFLSFLVALVVSTPVVERIRKVASDIRAGVAGGYAAVAPDAHKDELSSLTFMYNDAATELRLRKTRIDDQDEAMRRYVQATDEEVGRPLAELAGRLGTLELTGALPADALHEVLRRAHDLSAHAENLVAVSRLRAVGALPAETVDLQALVDGVVARHQPVAHAEGVSLKVSAASTPIRVKADAALLARALSNLVDNAVRYNRAGGQVTVALARDGGEGRFRLWVADNGRGVSEEEFRGLTAVRRFRGDEGRNRRPGAPGLGLAIAREVTDRFEMKLDLKRPGAGGFEVEISGAA